MPMQKFYAALLFGLLFFLPGNSLLAQETITSTGNYIDFSGSGFAAVPAIYPPPSTNNELTFESWVYIDNLPQDSDWDILYYLTDGWGVYLQQNGKLGFRYRVASAGNWPNLNSNTALSTGEWYHIAVTYSKSVGAMKIYINGVLDASSGSSSNMTYISDNRSNLIGARRQNSSSSAYGHFDGRLKHLRIWNDERSSSEINDNKDKVVAAETNLLRYYKFDEAQGSTVTDYSDYQKNATLAGDYVWGSDAFIDTVSPTVTLTHNASPTTVSNGDTVMVTATFSEAMQATPTINISGGQATYVAMSATASSAIWTYNWTVSSTVSTEVSVTVSGTDLAGIAYSGTESLTFSIAVDNDPPTLISLEDSIDSVIISPSQQISITATFSEPVTNTQIIIQDSQSTTQYEMTPYIDFDFDAHWRQNSSGVVEEPNNSGGAENLAYFGLIGGPSSHPQFNDLVIVDYGEGGDALRLFVETSEHINQLTGMTKVGNFRGSNYFYSSAAYNSLVQINTVLNELGATLSSIETQDEFDYLTSIFRNDSNLTQSGPYIFGLYQNTSSNEYSEPAGGWEWRAPRYTRWQYTWSVTSTLSGQVSLTLSAEDAAGNNYSATNSLTYNVISNPQLSILSLTQSENDAIVAVNDVVSITAVFSDSVPTTPTLSLTASDTYANAYVDLVQNQAMTAVDTSTWVYIWTVASTQTYDDITATVSISTQSASLTNSLTFVLDNNPPGINDLIYLSSSKQIEVGFNERVFGDASATQSITVDHFKFSLSGGSAELSSTAPLSITSSGTNYLLEVGLDGFSDGNEQLTLTTSSSIYDIVGNEFTIDNDSYQLDLIDDIRPSLQSSELRFDNSSIQLEFSEVLVASSLINFDSSTASSTQINIPTKTTATSSWEPWTHSFNLAVPDGYIVSKVKFEFDAMDQGWGGTNANATIKLNNTLLGKAKLTHSFQSFELEKSGNFPDFNYNGNNELKFYFMGWPGWSSTTKNGVLTVYYSPVDINANDFALSMSGGSASLSAGTPLSITVSGTQISLGVPLQGTPNGNETLQLSLVENALFDFAGNVVSPTTIDFSLFDKEASTIVTTTLSDTNTQVLVTFSEELNTFANWNNGEPNDMGTENHAHLTGGGTFNDHRLNQQFPSLIEINSTVTTLSNYLYVGTFGGHSYFKLNTSYTWENAKAHVDENGGYLAIVSSEAEKEFLKNQSLGDVWIGLYQDLNDPNYSEPSGGWKWVNGAYAAMDGINVASFSLSIQGGTASLTTSLPTNITALNSLTYAIELPLDGTASGEEIVTVNIVSNTLMDLEGNFVSNQQSNNRVQLKDNTAPIIVLSDDQNDINLAGNDQVVIKATSTEPLATAPLLIFSNQTTATLSTTASATQWEYTWTVPVELNGTVSITVEGIDVDNNANTQLSSLTYNIDNAGPNVSLETNQENSYLKAGESIVVTATFNEELSGACTLDIVNDLTSTQVSMSAVSSSVWAVAWAIPSNWNEGNFH